tara:strand:+ start:193 stop:693 length:501 start_codon:yes stop_codon:yes gene_type:complete
MNNKFDQLQNKSPSFIQKDVINVSTDAVWDFYLSNNAIKKLTPPFTPMQVIKNEPLAENSVTKMRIWLGPIPIIWEAKHFDFDTKIGFTDMQTSGPMKFWIHRHEIKHINEKQSIIEDKIWYKHFKGIRGIVSRIFFSKLAIYILFKYRSWATKRAIKKRLGSRQS